MTYTGHHIPTGEEWLILGIDHGGGRVCAAGWPPSIANLSDMADLKPHRRRTEEETIYMIKTFGHNFLSKEEPHGFCEKPDSNCTMNYCDDNGCAERKRHLAELKQEESQEERITDADLYAIEFASYMQSEAWELDYREQKTHSLREHLEYFKQKYG